MAGARRGTGTKLVRAAGGGVQRRASRAGGWTAARRTAFLNELAQSANVRAAVRAAGLSEAAAYKLRKREPGFALAWAEALSDGYAKLELLMLERAILALGGAEAAGTPIAPGDGGAMMKLSDRTILSLLAQHRQAVRDYRDTASPRAAAASEGESDNAVRARMEGILAAMHERLMAGAADTAPTAPADEAAGHNG